MPDLNGRELLQEWRALMEVLIASATSATARKDLPGELLGAMQRQLELVQEVVDRERRLQGDIATRLLAPLDAVFDLLEQAGATIRGQAEALEDAGRALEESAGLMKRQAALFERTIATLRQPTERAKGRTGKGAARKPRASGKATRTPRG